MQQPEGDKRKGGHLSPHHPLFVYGDLSLEYRVVGPPKVATQASARATSQADVAQPPVVATAIRNAASEPTATRTKTGGRSNGAGGRSESGSRSRTAMGR